MAPTVNDSALPRRDIGREPPGSTLESTTDLLGRIREGDTSARELLLARYLPLLRRWAHGRLPPGSRGLVETDDLVQVTLLRTLDQLHAINAPREGSFLAYLRRTLMNTLRNEIRRASYRAAEPLDENVADRTSLLEQMIGKEVVDAYEDGLSRLPESLQEAVILKLEFGYDYRSIADAIGSPSPNAARMLVSRAMLKLSHAMDAHR